MKIPLDDAVHSIKDLPYTISFIVRKRQQIDNLNEFPEEKRPPELMIWEGTSEEIDDWIKRVMTGKKDPIVKLAISEEDVEG